MANALTYQSEFTGQQMDARFTAVAQLQEALAALETAVAAKYVKPSTGIPETDLDAAVQSALALARTAIQSLSDYYTKAQVDDIAAAIAASVDSTSGVVVATLPSAGAGTLGKIYYVGPDANGFYDRYVTSYDGSTYTWLALGNTEVDMTQYATVEQLNQLDQEITGQTINVTGTGTWQVGRVLPQGIASSYTSYRYQRFNAKRGDTISYSGYADTSTVVFGIVQAADNITPVAMGAGASAVVTGQYEVLFDAEFVICGYNNMTEAVSILREGITQRLEDVEENVRPYMVDLLASISWQVGRVLATNGIPVASYTNYHYAVIPNVLKGEAISYSGKADSSTVVFGYAKPGIASFTSVAVGAGGSTEVSGTFVAPYDCSVVICSYNNVSSYLRKIVPTIATRVANVEELEPEIAGIRDDLGSKTENAIEYTVTEGKYINKYGVVSTLAGALLTSPIYLPQNTVIRLSGVATSAVAAISITDSEGTNYMPLVLGSDDQGGAFVMEYRTLEAGYYAFSSSARFLDIKRLTFSGTLEDVDKLITKVDELCADGANILAAFNNLVCVGDSLTWSQVYVGSGVSDQRQAKRTYPEVLASLCGNEYQLLGAPGDTAKHCWDTQNSSIVSKENPLAIIYLGTNYGLTDSLETDVVGDDPNEWADNNTGCYCRFVQKFQSLGYKVLLLKIRATSGTDTADLEHSRAAIGNIATRFGCAVLDVPVSSAMMYHYYPDLSGYNGMHYNDLGYAWFASALIKAVGSMSAEQIKLLIPNAS